MTRFLMALIFSSASLAGLALILYAVLAAPGTGSRTAEANDTVLGFSESAEQPGRVPEPDTRHESHEHREKEPFDPNKHKPEPL